MHLESDETLLCDLLADCMHLMGREAVEGRLFMAGEHYEAEGGRRVMTTGNHTHDRPMVNWCQFWQVMAARPTEPAPWWAVMAAKVREWWQRI
jgi:hypothetical protein